MAKPEQEDHEFVRCANCGFPCKLSRDKIRAGNGKTYFEIPNDGPAPHDSIVKFGCPLCGLGEYNTN